MEFHFILNIICLREYFVTLNHTGVATYPVGKGMHFLWISLIYLLFSLECQNFCVDFAWVDWLNWILQSVTIWAKWETCYLRVKREEATCLVPYEYLLPPTTYSPIVLTQIHSHRNEVCLKAKFCSLRKQIYQPFLMFLVCSFIF